MVRRTGVRKKKWTKYGKTAYRSRVRAARASGVTARRFGDALTQASQGILYTPPAPSSMSRGGATVSGSYLRPYSVKRKLVYAASGFAMTTAAALFNTMNVFRGNSPYDPDQTGVGVQPHGWDEFAALYDKYRVYASAIECRFSTITPTTTMPKIRCFLLANDSASITNTLADDFTARPDTQECWFNNLKPGVLKMYRTTADIYPDYEHDNDFSAAVTTNPTKQWYWRVCCDTLEDGAGASITMNVKISYYIEFFCPKSLAAS